MLCCFVRWAEEAGRVQLRKYLGYGPPDDAHMTPICTAERQYTGNGHGGGFNN